MGGTSSAPTAIHRKSRLAVSGRLVARQLDDSHIVIRASFEFRDLLLQSFPETFSVPKRFAQHMMVVADLENGNADAVEDAVIGAWGLQSGK
jgi:hypothetical protein